MTVGQDSVLLPIDPANAFHFAGPLFGTSCVINIEEKRFAPISCNERHDWNCGGI